MPSLVSLLLPLVLLFSSLTVSSAQAQSVPPPALAARAWLLVDFATGQHLAGHEVETRVEPASLTKLMTAYLTFAALKSGTITMEQQVHVSERAWRMIGSRMFIEPRKPVTVEELVRGMIIQSGNDACVALAELIAGSEEAFAHLMNREAQRLGMNNTNFTNSSGLPGDQHYTSVRDLGLLAAALVRDFPEFYAYYSEKSYTYNSITQPNRNRLLFMDDTVDGMKTGHTSAAGYCLVSSALRGERRLIAVLVGAENDTIRMQESLKLLNYGFQFFDTVRLYAGGQVLSEVEVWKGGVDRLPVGFSEDFVLSLPKGQSERIEVALETRQPVVAPIEAGQEIGTLTLRLDGNSLGSYPVVALQEVLVGGFFSRSWDALRMWIKGL